VIPLRDVIPSRTVPFVTIALIAINTLAWLFELQLTADERQQLLTIYGIVPAAFAWPTLFSSMFLHGGWLHFLGNMLYLWIFGDNVEDRFGHLRYLIFYLLSGAAAGLGHLYVSPESRLPTIGASGAIAGVMGAYFVMFPHSRVLTLIPLFIIWELIEVPAILFLGVWFIMQLLSGVGSIASTSADAGGIAFWAHIAGFASGIVGVALFRRRARRALDW
jgi:membrane associated rhomboid family serine protease